MKLVYTKNVELWLNQYQHIDKCTAFLNDNNSQCVHEPVTSLNKNCGVSGVGHAHEVHSRVKLPLLRVMSYVKVNGRATCA